MHCLLESNHDIRVVLPIFISSLLVLKLEHSGITMVHAMAVNALAPCIAKSSSIIILTMQDKQIHVYHWEGISHYGDVIMGAIASIITSLATVYPTVYSDADQRKHQSSASLAFVRGNHKGPVNSPHKWPVTRKMFPFDDVIMNYQRPLSMKT